MRKEQPALRVQKHASAEDAEVESVAGRHGEAAATASCTAHWQPDVIPRLLNAEQVRVPSVDGAAPASASIAGPASLAAGPFLRSIGPVSAVSMPPIGGRPLPFWVILIS